MKINVHLENCSEIKPMDITMSVNPNDFGSMVYANDKVTCSTCRAVLKSLSTSVNIASILV